MKQETGNSQLTVQKEMSIRLRSDGHSFPEIPAEVLRAGKVRCTVITHKTVLMPREYFDRAAAENALAIAGLSCEASETAVYSDPQSQQIAIMALDKTKHHRLVECFGDRLSYTSPLLFEPKISDTGVWLQHCEGILYIKLYNKVLRVAEAVRAQGTTDILYYINKLNESFPLREYPLYLSGNKVLAQQLRTFFREVKCE